MKTKRQYVKPIAKVTIIEIENGIAAGSGRALANDDSYTMFSEWEEENENITIDFNFHN